MLHGNFPEWVGSGRGGLWKGAMELIGQSPILGGGPGSFLARYTPYNKWEGVAVDFAHNDFLNIGVCTGLVGLGLYVAFLVTLLYRCLRAVGRCPILLVLMAGMLGYLTYSFFVFSIAIVSPMFWAMPGLADKGENTTKTGESGKEPSIEPRLPPQRAARKG